MTELPASSAGMMELTRIRYGYYQFSQSFLDNLDHR